MKGQEYKGYVIAQGDGRKTGNKRIEIFDGQGNYVTSFAYHALNLGERAKRIQKAKDHVDKLVGDTVRE